MSDAAVVLDRGLNRITFAVDDVTPGSERFPTQSLWTNVEKLTGRSILAISHASNFRVIEDRGHHALIGATEFAYRKHLPLALTPDSLWLTIAQGFAQHVRNHVEELRPLLVRHRGKKRLEATISSLPQPEDWADVVDQWARQIGAELPSTLHDTLVCDFSTTTPLIRTASQVVMMEVFHPYFDFEVYAVCGIPQITLHGSPEDWRAIRARVERLAPYHLEWWTDRLLPICDALIATAEGCPPREFWQQIYWPQYPMCGSLVAGWIADLFPYVLDDTATPKIRNPLFNTPWEELTSRSGLQAEKFPSGLSSASALLIQEQPVRKESGLEFLGGFFGVVQEPQSGCLQPEVAWGVQAQSALGDMLTTLVRDHPVVLPTQAVSFLFGIGLISAPAEIVQMLGYFDGGTLFAETAHPWKVRSWRNYTVHDLGRAADCVCFLDLPDGRGIGFHTVYLPEEARHAATGSRYACWIVLARFERVQDRTGMSEEIYPAKDTVVIATSLSAFLQRMLQAEGRYYFDSPDFIPEVTGKWD